MRQHLEVWGDMLVAWKGTYLGFVVGPGKHDSSWYKPSEKYKERCAVWADHSRGLQFNALTYSTLAVSTLCFVAQLAAPPAWMLEQEKTMLLKAAPGPRYWASVEDLWHLKDSYGFPRSFPCLTLQSQASQLRVFVWDPAFTDKREMRDTVTRLRRLLDCFDMPYTRCGWRDWFDRSFLLRIDDNHREFTSTVCQVAILHPS